MKYIFALIALLIIITACAPAPLVETVKEDVAVQDNITANETSANPCDSVTCGSNEHCSNGACEKDKICNYGEELKDNECQCSQNFKRCGEQRQCIPYDACCGLSACNPDDSYDRECIPTRYGAQLCFKTAAGEHCRYAYQNERTAFSIEKESADVMISQIFADNSLSAEVIQKGVKTNITMLEQEGTAPIANGYTLTYNFISTAGGNCRSEEPLAEDDYNTDA